MSLMLVIFSELKYLKFISEFWKDYKYFKEYMGMKKYWEDKEDQRGSKGNMGKNEVRKCGKGRETRLQECEAQNVW